MDNVIRYRREEVAKHNGKNNTQLWIIVKDIVYDVSTHVSEVIKHYPGRFRGTRKAGHTVMDLT